MDLRTEIFTDVSAIQADILVETGDLFIRDGQLVIVLEAQDGQLRWLKADGSEEEGPEAVFRERALERYDLGEIRANFLDSLWQLASSREIPGQIRARAVQAASGRARTEEEKNAARRWAARLFGGMEPVRSWVPALGAGGDPAYEWA